MRSIFSDEEAVSEIVGFVILLTLTITVIGILLMMSIPALTESQDRVQQQNIEQAFTLLDSHTSKAQYSNYLSQSTEMKLNGGRVYVDQSDSWIRIILNNTQVYNGTLGTIHYELNGQNVGYQAGGIWVADGKGGSTMISAPDFNYKHETLTLPLMQIIGNSSAAGNGKTYITARSGLEPEIVFPLGTSTLSSNPISADQVYAYITTDYYVAWANYINTRTECAVRPGDINRSNKTIKVTFNTKPSCGTHPFTPPIWFRGLNTSNPNPVNEFYFNLTDVHSNSNLDLRGPQSNSPPSYPALHVNFQKASGGGTSGMRIVVDYYVNSTLTEQFTASGLFYIYPNDTANINLLNSSIPTEYTPPGGRRSVTWGTSNTTDDAGDLNNHDASLTMDQVIQHYMSLMANRYSTGFALWKGNDGGQAWPGASSSYTLDYDAVNVLTYMHITNNKIEVSV